MNVPDSWFGISSVLHLVTMAVLCAAAFVYWKSRRTWTAGLFAVAAVCALLDALASCWIVSGHLAHVPLLWPDVLHWAFDVFDTVFIELHGWLLLVARCLAMVAGVGLIIDCARRPARGRDAGAGQRTESRA